jgi:RNA polymerase sigma-70 factor (sigma-E family)
MADAVVNVLGRERGATASFAEIYNAHHRRAVRLAWLLTGDPHAAEDVVADAMTKVWRQWERGRVDDVGPYLRSAVVNQVRSRGRRKLLERREADKRHGDARGVRLHDEHIADRDELWQALNELPPRQRQTIVLRYYEDLSEADTAELLGCSVGTVKSQVSRGIARMRELIGEPTRGGA